MVESSPNNKFQFVKIDQQELKTALALALKNSSRIIFWKTTSKFFEGKIHFLRDKSTDLNIHIHYTFLSANVIESELCLNFTSNDVEYFFKGRVNSAIDEENLLEVSVGAEGYRVEKRLLERVLVYPKYQCFLYLNYEKSVSNIVQFNKADKKEDDFLRLLSSSTQNMFSGNGNEEIFGMRIEDLSANGLAGVVSNEEYNEIISRFENTTFSAVLMFDSQSFTLSEIKIKYFVNYLNANFKNVKMQKIGCTFKRNIQLKRYLEELTGITLEREDYYQAFSDFIKND